MYFRQIMSIKIKYPHSNHSALNSIMYVFAGGWFACLLACMVGVKFLGERKTKRIHSIESWIKSNQCKTKPTTLTDDLFHNEEKSNALNWKQKNCRKNRTERTIKADLKILIRRKRVIKFKIISFPASTKCAFHNVEFHSIWPKNM